MYSSAITCNNVGRQTFATSYDYIFVVTAENEKQKRNIGVFKYVPSYLNSQELFLRNRICADCFEDRRISFVDQNLASIFLRSHNELQWYRRWVHDQVQKQPTQLFSTLHGYDPKKDDRWISPFSTMWKEISKYMTVPTTVSIDGIVAHLLESGIIEFGSDPNAPIAAKNLVFAVIGWQTMLYQADMHSCPPEQLAIQSEMGAHQGLARLCLKQSHSSCKRTMHQFLFGYGILLPPRNFEGYWSLEDKKSFAEFKSASPAHFNAYILSSLGGVDIEWVDSLSCHMEFDPYLNKLFLFRYPSFCLANIPPDESEQPSKSVIHACATSWDSSGQWATESDVTQMLKEIIRSYRLVFGQNKASRQLFQTLAPFENIPENGKDPFLEQLCGRKHYQSDSNDPEQERETYDLVHDFPILRNRLLPLLRHLASKKPRTWKQLWEDKRDSSSWLTFWAVIIIGGMGLILAMLQTILQIVQVIQH